MAFETISPIPCERCAGEVNLGEDDDYAKFAMQIRYGRDFDRITSSA